MTLVALLVAVAVPAQTGEQPKVGTPVVSLSTPRLDPAKANVARSVANRLLPAGNTREVLGGTYNATVINLVHSYLMMPVQQLADSVGVNLREEGTAGP